MSLDEIALIRRELASRPSDGRRDDRAALVALGQALDAAASGNYGIGAVVASSDGRVLSTGQNRVFNPIFRSDLHAEMDALNHLEDAAIDDLQDAVLLTTVECCPMCLSRLVVSKVPSIRYMAPDKEGGMIHLIGQMPRVWQDLARRKEWARADCSPALFALARRIFDANVSELDARLGSVT